MDDLRTVIVPKGTIIKINGIPFILEDDTKIKGMPSNIAMIFDSTKKIDEYDDSNETTTD